MENIGEHGDHWRVLSTLPWRDWRAWRILENMEIIGECLALYRGEIGEHGEYWRTWRSLESMEIIGECLALNHGETCGAFYPMILVHA